MLGDHSAVLANSAPPPPPGALHDGGDDEIGGSGGGGGGSNSGDDIDKSIGGDRMSYGGNRWPRQETLALLKIRSDMDAVFRDSSVKGPLWEDVSRKLAELGFHRNAKKCKEKFENVYKYHRRTKEGRTGKSEGKTYRFFDQLEAFGTNTPPPQPQLVAAPPPPQQQPPQKAQPAAMATSTTTTLPWSNPPTISHATVPSTTNHHHIHMNNNISPIPVDPIIDSPNPLSSSQPLNPYPNNMIFPSSFQNLTSHLFSSSTSSSTASDEEMQGGSRKRKRRWKDFFERLTTDVIKKQEDLQRKFLETVEKREQERIAREESWRAQEIARINREHEILIQERSTAAAKDAALISFLQKISGQQISLQTLNAPPPLLPPLSTPAPTPPAPVPPPAPVLKDPCPALVSAPPPVLVPAADIVQTPKPDLSIIVAKKDHNVAIGASPSPSRWPKVEVEALISLRTNLDIKYQENGPKGPLWEEISGEMQKLGYNRSSKRCKEKWENINKYFKKVKENRKNRPEDSKTCPYFHQLNAIYKDRSKSTTTTSDHHSINNNNNAISTAAPEPPQPPLMVRPEQQWPESHRLELNRRDNNMEEEDELDEGEMDTDEEDEGGGEFQVVANKPLAPLANGVC